MSYVFTIFKILKFRTTIVEIIVEIIVGGWVVSFFETQYTL